MNKSNGSSPMDYKTSLLMDYKTDEKINESQVKNSQITFHISESPDNKLSFKTNDNLINLNKRYGKLDANQEISLTRLCRFFKFLGGDKSMIY